MSQAGFRTTRIRLVGAGHGECEPFAGAYPRCYCARVMTGGSGIDGGSVAPSAPPQTGGSW